MIDSFLSFFERRSGEVSRRSCVAFHGRFSWLFVYYYVVFVYLAAAKVCQRFDDLERLFEGFGPQGERNAYGGVDAFVDPEADVVPVFQIDGDVGQRHVVEDDRVARPAAIVAGRDVAHGDRARTGVVGAALVRGEDDRLSAR